MRVKDTETFNLQNLTSFVAQTLAFDIRDSRIDRRQTLLFARTHLIHRC